MAYSKLGTSTGILKVTEPDLECRSRHVKYSRLEDTEQRDNSKEIVHQSSGGRQSDSVKESQAAQCLSVDRDMDDRNGKSHAGNPPELVTSAANKAAQTSVELSGFVKEDDIDPFTYYPPFTKWDYIKITINALWLFPLRLFFVVIPSIIVGTFACTLAIMCDKYDENDLHPLNRWGRFMMGVIGPIVTRVFLFGFGFNWIQTRGKLVTTKEAPILVVSPHSCLLDIFVISIFSKFPTFLAKSSVKHIPIFGTLITRTMRTIYVERSDPDSKMKAAEEIRRRTHTRGEWPKVLLFPEGTTTNTKALISFKQGAFLPKLPVQPVLIKYKNKLNTTTWGEDGLGVLGSLFLTMCQFHNSLEVEFLPVYDPSDEEIENPKLFARNVQIHMAKAYGVPYTNHAFEDVLLMRSARKAGLPFRSGMVVYLKANSDLNMDMKTMNTWLHRFVIMDEDKDGFITLEDFARFLQISASDDGGHLKDVFNATKLEEGKLGFRHYLYGIVGKAQPLLQDANLMQTLFSFFDSNGDGVVKMADISNRLPFKSFPCLHDSKNSNQQHQGNNSEVESETAEHESNTPHQYEVAVPEEMDLEQFSSLLATHPEYVLIFREYQKASVSSHLLPPIANGREHSLPLQLETAATEITNEQSLVNGHVTQKEAVDWLIEDTVRTSEHSVLSHDKGVRRYPANVVQVTVEIEPQ